MSRFGNIMLSDGVSVFAATLDRDIEFTGDYGSMSERRARITVPRAIAAGFVRGGVLSADPATYSVDEILAMEKSRWKLDALEKDDGRVVSWWLR